jgi:hypothetical protein
MCCAAVLQCCQPGRVWQSGVLKFFAICHIKLHPCAGCITRVQVVLLPYFACHRWLICLVGGCAGLQYVKGGGLCQQDIAMSPVALESEKHRDTDSPGAMRHAAAVQSDELSCQAEPDLPQNGVSAHTHVTIFPCQCTPSVCFLQVRGWHCQLGSLLKMYAFPASLCASRWCLLQVTGSQSRNNPTVQALTMAL